MGSEGKYDSDSMMHQAQHIWSMLDDMANSDPKAYRNFIDKHIKEGQQMMAPPTPHMCVQTVMLAPKRKPFFINFCAWERVPCNKTPEDAVPVTGTEISEGRDEGGSYSMTSCAFNPKILEEYGHDTKSPTDRDTLVNLAIDFIHNQHKVELSRNYTLLSKDIPHKGEITQLHKSFSKKTEKGTKEFESQLSELESSFGPLAAGAKDSLLNKLANMTTDDGSSSQRSKGQSSGTSYDMPNLKLPVQTETKRTGLIEELGSECVTKLTCPVHNMEVVRDGRGNIDKVVIKIELPGVRSVAECELDISEDDVKLAVEDTYDLHLPLPCKIVEDESTAKFSKKTSVLTVTLPALCQS